MNEVQETEELARTKLNLETSKIAWKDLQRHFAAGMVLKVGNGLDLVEAAYELSCDNKTVVEQWLADGSLGMVADEQALAWFDQDAELWAVVVRPWVLVQSAD